MTMHKASFTEIESFLNKPGSHKVVLNRTERVMIAKIPHIQLDQQRDHWRKLHTTIFTPQEFELWIQAIPGCSSCQRDFRRLIENNAPRFDDWHKWTWEIHNAVNEKLGKQLIAWTDAIQLWNWSIKDIPDGNAEDSS